MSPDGDAPKRRSALQKKIEFIKPYSMAFGSSALLFATGWATRHGRARIVEMCRSLGYEHDRRVFPTLPSVPAKSVAPEEVPVTIVNLDASDGNVSEKELVIISRMVAHRKPSRIFEIGTFDGRTTANLAANAAGDRTVFTIDLPADEMSKLTVPVDEREIAYIEKAVSGARYKGTSVEMSIVQLYGDSARFDFSEYRKSIDFVFVDASHAYEYVMSDSLNAIEMLRDKGVIVWHDYGRWDGVTAALHKLRRENTAFARLKWIEGTTLAVLER
ncbi:MAG TPA: class I SAM-dependent methyltransferase [Gemmatimonadaceae bacterium]